MIAWMQKVARHPALHVVLAVALLAVWLVLESIPGIAALSLHGPDDKLRLVQVRDLLAGQSWFDVSQARIAPPDGGAMHWSRLVDVPLAGTILLAEPALGRAGAERLAVVLVPLLTLLVVAGLTVATARRAAMPSGAKVAKLAGLAALVVFLTWIPATRQMVPLRIDHHGWQTACAALALWALLSPRFVRGAAVAEPARPMLIATMVASATKRAPKRPRGFLMSSSRNAFQSDAEMPARGCSKQKLNW